MHSDNLQLLRMANNGRMHFVPICLLILLLLAIIAGSFHHHHDLQEHPDCVICVFITHSPVKLDNSSLIADHFLFPPPKQVIVKMQWAVIARWTGTTRGRAPPITPPLHTIS